MKDTLVLCYHAVSDQWPASLSVRPERFRAQLEFLVRSGYRGATFTQAVTDPPAGKVLAVTFDDNYRSVVRLAHPIMERFGLPGTVFVPTTYVGTEQPMSWSGLEQWLGSAHEPELVAASWPELQELQQAGWEIGAHTRTHPHLTQIDEAVMHDELAGSRSDVEAQVDGSCTSLAYPYGDHDARVVEAAANAGFHVAAALPTRWYSPSPLRWPHHPEPLRWPRVYISNRDDMRRFRLKVSRPFRALRIAASIATDALDQT